MSEFAKYPSWRYHRDKKPVVVNNAEEEEALGPGWEDSPAKFKAEKQKKEAEQAGIQRRYHERFDAARNDGDQQGLLLREYASSYPEVASTDPWYLRMSSLIPAFQVRAKATEAPTDNEEEQPAALPKDTPERNTWQKKLDDPIKYEWMTIPETMQALGNCSNKTVYRKLDEGKLEYHSSVKPIRVKTESVIRLLKEKSE